MSDTLLKYIKKILLFIFLVSCFLGFEIIYILIFKFLNIDVSTITFKQNIILTLIKELFFVLLLAIIYRKYLKEKWIDFKNNFTSYFELGFKSWFLGLIGMIFLNNIISKIASPIVENENAVQTIINNFPTIALILTTLLAPIVEELIFRKSLQDIKLPKWIFIIVSGLIFGYVHLIGSENPLDYLYILPYGLLGSCFAYTLSKTDNIYVTIMMHMLHNGILTLLSVVI